jgi:hypothetical protein
MRSTRRPGQRPAGGRATVRSRADLLSPADMESVQAPSRAMVMGMGGGVILHGCHRSAGSSGS